MQSNIISEMARKELARRELDRRSKQLQQNNQQEGFINKVGNFAEENITKPIEKYAVNPALEAVSGAVQGTANVPSGIYNLAREGANLIPGIDLPKAPTLDLIPHTLASELGNVGAFAANPFRMIAKAPEVYGAAKNAMKIPMIAEHVSKAANMMKNNYLTSKIAGNSLLGAGYSPEHPVLGASLGGAVPLAQKAYETGKPLLQSAFSKFDSGKVAEKLQNSHDKLESFANDMFNKVGSEVEKRGISKVPIDKSLIDNLEELLPKTDKYKRLIKKIRSNDFKSLREAQTDLWNMGTSRKSSVLHSEKDVGEEILNFRDKINESISNHFEKTGHADLSNILNEARTHWHKLKDVYYGNYTPNAISNLVQKGYRKKPKNIMNVLSEDSDPMRKILEENPMILKDIELFGEKKNAMGKLKKLGIGAGIIGGTIGGMAATPIPGKIKELGNMLL